MPYYHILLPQPFDHGFTYRSDIEIPIGTLVKVPFRSKYLIGINWGVEERTDISSDKIKTIADIYPLLFTQAQRDFLSRLADYNLIPLGSVIKMALAVPDALTKLDKYTPAELDLSAIQLASLTKEQDDAYKYIIERQKSGFDCLLLDGVTGSGKTEVYLNAVAEVIKENGQALVLLPEIVLTSQLINRFETRFGFRPLEWHSNLTSKTRRENWQRVAKGDAKFIVGARSALFLPFNNLKLIVIDEEHDQSFKQEEGAIYNARDMAILKAKLENIAIILSSATPSIESIYNVQNKKYKELKLHSRFGDAVLPEIKLIDLSKEIMPKNQWISNTLRQVLTINLASGQQSMLFLNRRGYAPITMCGNCFSKVICPNCNFHMVEHRSKAILQCHYCGHNMPTLTKCQECGSEDKIYSIGPGVERIAEELEQTLPQARIMVLTSDTMMSRKSVEEALDKIHAHEVDIIVGTQLLTKGLHFPKLNIVGVLDADGSINGGDIRTMERTYQLLHQVAGRAGREKEKGIVYIQTHEPNSILLQNLVNNDREAFVSNELENRKLANMPPFSRLISISISSLSEADNITFCQALSKNMPDLDGITILGPSPAPMYVLKRQYRHRFIIIAARDISIQKIVKQWLNSVQRPRNIKIRVDVDPYSFA